MIIFAIIIWALLGIIIFKRLPSSSSILITIFQIILTGPLVWLGVVFIDELIAIKCTHGNSNDNTVGSKLTIDMNKYFDKPSLHDHVHCGTNPLNETIPPFLPNAKIQWYIGVDLASDIQTVKKRPVDDIYNIK